MTTQVPPPQVSLYLEQARNPALSLCPISSPHPHITAYQQGKLLPCDITLTAANQLLRLRKRFIK